MKEKVLYSDASGCGTIRYVTGEIIMDPTLSSLERRVQAAKHRIRNANSYINVGPGKSLEDNRVGIEKLDSSDIIGFEEVHHLGRWQRVGSRGAPVHTYGYRPRKMY